MAAHSLRLLLPLGSAATRHAVRCPGRTVRGTFQETDDAVWNLVGPRGTSSVASTLPLRVTLTATLALALSSYRR